MDSTDPHVTVVKHSASGATAKIHALGATVISFVDAVEHRERLFVSKLAKFDGSKAIRGGIPICFPQFGPPSPSSSPSTMPQHGFARVNYWRLQPDSVKDDAELGATATFVLDYATDVTQGCGEQNPWSKEQAAKDGTNCRLVYEIKVLPHELVTTLLIKNTGSSSFSYQALLHSYFAIEASADAGVTVTGLGGYAITDKVTLESGRVQSYDEPVAFCAKDAATAPEIDRIYIHPEHHPVLEHVTINQESALEAAALVDGHGEEDDVVLPVSCVVWNPGPAKAQAMSDFDDDEYKSMVCVEPGIIGHQPLLEPKAQARLSQTIRVIQKKAA